jgi:voltage-gated sodium channel
MLNLFIGIIVNTMQELHEAGHTREREQIEQVVHEDTAGVAEEVRALRREIAALRSALDARERT